MNKTIRLLLLMLIISGLIFTACRKEGEVEKSKDPESKPGFEETPPGVNFEFEGEDSESVEESLSDSTPSVFLYEDGTYVETGNYETPGGTESIRAEVTLEDGKVKALTVTPSGINETSKIYQGLFVEGINQLVVGKDLGELGDFGQVNGSSLSPKGFAGALSAIKASARNA